MNTLKSMAVEIFATRREFNQYPSRMEKVKRRIIAAQTAFNKNPCDYNAKEILKIQNVLLQLETEFDEAKEKLPKLEAAFLAKSLDQFR